MDPLRAPPGALSPEPAPSALGLVEPPAGPAWPSDERLGRQRFRAFALAQPAATHALLVGGARVSVRAVAEDLSVLARWRHQSFGVVGPASLGRTARLAGWPLLPETLLARPAGLTERLAREVARAAPPSGGTCLLMAPSTASVPALEVVDRRFDTAPLGEPFARFCLVPKSALRREGGAGALGLLQRHAVSHALS